MPAFLSLRIDWSNLVLALLVAAVGTASTVSSGRRIPNIIAFQKVIQADYVPPRLADRQS